MFLYKLVKPHKSIFDIFKTWKVFNIIFGVACFSSIQREDGVKIHFADKGDQIYSLAVTVISTSASLMFFVVDYFPMDTTLEDFLYKAIYLYLSWSGTIARIIMSRRISEFLKAFHLIEEIDSKLRKNCIPVDYEASREVVTKTLIAFFTANSTLYFVYIDEHIPDHLRFYHFVNILFSDAWSLITLSFIFSYNMLICLTLTRRFELLNLHFDTLRRTRNVKKLENGLLLISDIHMKLCQCWSYTISSMGSCLIFIHGAFYIYCLYPLVHFDYVLSRVKNEMIPILILMFYLIFVALQLIQRLKDQVQKLKNNVIEFSLEKENSEPIVKKMCSTLLLQMEHVDIGSVFGGFFVVDLEEFLSGIKGTSTFMMFTLQMNNSNMF